MNRPEKTKIPRAKLLDNGRIQISPDVSTVVSRKIRESDRTDYPELFTASSAPSAEAASDELAAKKADKLRKRAERAAAKAAKEAERVSESQADS